MNSDILDENNIDEARFEFGSLFMFAVVKDINDEGTLWLDDDKKSRLVFQVEGSPEWAMFDGADDIDQIVEILQKLKRRMVKHDLVIERRKHASR